MNINLPKAILLALAGSISLVSAQSGPPRGYQNPAQPVPAAPLPGPNPSYRGPAAPQPSSLGQRINTFFNGGRAPQQRPATQPQNRYNAPPVQSPYPPENTRIVNGRAYYVPSPVQSRNAVIQGPPPQTQSRPPANYSPPATQRQPVQPQTQAPVYQPVPGQLREPSSTTSRFSPGMPSTNRGRTAPRSVHSATTRPTISAPSPKPRTQTTPPEPEVKKETASRPPEKAPAPKKKPVTTTPKKKVEQTPPKPKSEAKKETVKTETKSSSSTSNKTEYLVGKKTSKSNRVVSPHEPYNELDITGLTSGQLAIDPTTKKIFRVP